MRTLIISDIHCKIDRVQELVDRVNLDRIISLGDWFDKRDNTPQEVERTAQYLVEIRADKRWVKLFGNHEMGYRFPISDFTYCTGWLPWKRKLIRAIMREEDWQGFKWFHVQEGFLFTHAGLHPMYLPGYLKHYSLDNIGNFLRRESLEANIKATVLMDHWFYRCGKARAGGTAKKGGIVWLDFKDEFKPIKGIKQVFGHTHLKEPTWNGDNLCLDTGLNHYAILENGNITTHCI